MVAEVCQYLQPEGGLATEDGFIDECEQVLNFTTVHANLLLTVVDVGVGGKVADLWEPR
jgi:hypothetical protein